MNAAQRLAHRHIPSFKREADGMYGLYATLYSKIYAARMRHLHRRGRHGRTGPGLDTRCQWCGKVR